MTTITTTVVAVRAEALFASPLQRGDAVSADQVTTAVDRMLRQLGVNGCAAVVAGEYGDHPNTAAARMTWALATVSRCYCHATRPAN